MYRDAENVFRAVVREIRDTGTFTVTEQHLTLLRRAYVGWDPCEFGAPAIDAKRPYGNSDVLNDLADILDPGWADSSRRKPGDWDDDAEEEYIEQNADRLTRLHAETAIALQIALSTGKFEAGRYVMGSNYDNTSWRPATD